MREYLIQLRDLSGPREAGIALIGPLHQTSGLGQATRLSYEILSASETVKTDGLALRSRQPAPIGFATELKMLPFDRPREINLIHLNAESIPLAFAFEQREILSDSYNIGYFFWELDKLPKCQQLGIELVDEIWVSSEYNREIYAQNTSKPGDQRGMAVEALPDAAPASLSQYGIPEGGTVFLTTFDSFSFIERKNPIATIEAFLAAFPDRRQNATLIIKTLEQDPCPRSASGRALEAERSADQAGSADHPVERDAALQRSPQPQEGLRLLRSLWHRSEGWGFGMIEAMQLGCPVIATGYGGNMDFCTPETAYLVDYDLVGVRTEEYIFVERAAGGRIRTSRRPPPPCGRLAADKAAARAKGAGGGPVSSPHSSASGRSPVATAIA